MYVHETSEIHDFSIHLIPPLNLPHKRSNAYLSVSKSIQTLDNSVPLSIYSKLYFFNPRFNNQTNTFTAVVYWPHSFKGVDYTEYTLTFVKDMRCISGGHMIHKKENGVVLGR